ncbi:MAG: TonB-dependent receptor [Verrucomicrobiales bacterium]|nr:TonB-dependent receptor [Verrucomicrobiales bacterium]
MRHSINACRDFKVFWFVRLLTMGLGLLPVSFPQTIIASVLETNTFNEPTVTYLKKFSLQELMDMKVTSVSRSPESLSTAPAAITVITGDDIRRSGFTSIPEALRLAPGLTVARESSFWAISSRGNNDLIANKLLVLIDGRSVYSPLFAGVFWGVQDTLLEDIDRIEVIRGPGATQWGANAVNGIINIITKSAKETQGLLISGGGGTEERVFGEVRYGGRIKEDTYFRIYGKYFDRDNSKLSNGQEARDRWEAQRGGFRLDWEATNVSHLTLQGDVYDGFQDEVILVPIATPPYFMSTFGNQVGGGNLLGRLTRTLSEESEMILQTYYDNAKRTTPLYQEDRDLGDIDFQHRFQLGTRQQVTWGLGYRVSHDQFDGTLGLNVFPASRTTQLFTSFLQDEVVVVPDKFLLTLGTKLEHNDFTGFEIQPSIKAVWTPAEHHAIWGAVSRAVRTPSRVEDDVVGIPAGVPPGVFSFRGQRDFESEELLAFELGYRVQPHAKLSLDFTLFYNLYDNLGSVEPVTPSLAVFANEASAENWGFEFAPSVQATKSWRLSGGYSFLESDIHLGPRSLDLFVKLQEGSSPAQQFFLRSSVDLGRKVEWDTIVRYVDRLSSLDVPGYFSLDMRLACKLGKHTEIAIVGQSLLSDRHVEFRPSAVGGLQTEVERGVYGKITWRF